MKEMIFESVCRNPRSIGAQINSPCAHTNIRAREKAQPNLSEEDKISQFLNLSSPKMREIYSRAHWGEILLPKGTIWPYSYENAEMAIKLFGKFAYKDMWGELRLNECEIEIAYVSAEEIARKKTERIFNDGCMDRPSRKRTHINR